MKLQSVECINSQADKLFFRKVNVVVFQFLIRPRVFTYTVLLFPRWLLSNFLCYYSGQETRFRLQTTGHTTSLAETKPCGMRLAVIIQDSDNTTD